MNLTAWDKLFTESPDDWDSRLVYADWLEDEGLSVLATGQRWQAAHKRHPAVDLRSETYEYHPHSVPNWKTIQLRPPTYNWYSYDYLPLGYYTVTSGVWMLLIDELRDLVFHYHYHYVIYSTRHGAEAALAEALHIGVALSQSQALERLPHAQ